MRDSVARTLHLTETLVFKLLTILYLCPLQQQTLSTAEIDSLRENILTVMEDLLRTADDYSSTKVSNAASATNSSLPERARKEVASALLTARSLLSRSSVPNTGLDDRQLLSRPLLVRLERQHALVQSLRSLFASHRENVEDDALLHHIEQSVERLESVSTTWTPLAPPSGAPQHAQLAQAAASPELKAVQEVFPECGEGFLALALRHYRLQREALITALLEGSLPPHLQSLPRALTLEEAHALLDAQLALAAASGKGKLRTPQAPVEELFGGSNTARVKTKRDEDWREVFNDEKARSEIKRLTLMYEDEPDDSYAFLQLHSFRSIFIAHY